MSNKPTMAPPLAAIATAKVTAKAPKAASYEVLQVGTGQLARRNTRKEADKDAVAFRRANPDLEFAVVPIFTAAPATMAITDVLQAITDMERYGVATAYVRKCLAARLPESEQHLLQGDNP